MNPSVREIIKKKYYDQVLISTEPTLKGKDLDVTKYKFQVKRIVKRPLSYFTDETFAMILDCEKKELIKLKFTLKSSDNNLLVPLKFLF